MLFPSAFLDSLLHFPLLQSALRQHIACTHFCCAILRQDPSPSSQASRRSHPHPLRPRSPLCSVPLITLASRAKQPLIFGGIEVKETLGRSLEEHSARAAKPRASRQRKCCGGLGQSMGQNKPCPTIWVRASEGSDGGTQKQPDLIRNGAQRFLQPKLLHDSPVHCFWACICFI